MRLLELTMDLADVLHTTIKVNTKTLKLLEHIHTEMQQPEEPEQKGTVTYLHEIEEEPGL